MFSSGFRELDSLLGGYAEKSTVLVTGPVNVGKDILAYRFLQSGIHEGDSCLYVTRQLVTDILRDAYAQGIDIRSASVTWIAAAGADRKFVSNDLAKLSFSVKEFLKENSAKSVRILLDSLSSLLLTNSSDSVYRFLVQLFSEVKLYDACVLALVEEDMHSPNVIASMEQIFDGVLNVNHGDDDSSIIEVRKMTGVYLPSRSRVVIARGSIGEREAGLAEGKGRKRIAVLPFLSLSPDPNDEFFADGLTEELIDRLCQLRELEVIARTSVMTYKNKEKKVTEIGKELRVGTLLEGSIRKSGDRIRVTAQVIDVETEGHLWSSRYDKELQDIFAVQSDIAEKITEALKLQLVDTEKEDIARKATSIPEAYVAYLNGLYFRNKGSVEGLRKGVQYLSNAIELDPNYAEAFAELAIDYIFLGVFWSEPVAQAFSKAKELVEKALELNSKIAHAYYAKSWVSYFYDMDWAAAEREGKSAVELRPSYAEPWIPLGYLHMGLGRKDEALKDARRAVDLDPIGIYSHLVLARVLSTFGMFEEAIVEHNKAIEIEPNSTFLHRELGFTYLYMGKMIDGVREMEKGLELQDRAFAKLGVGYGYAVSGRREEALKIAGEVQEAKAKGTAMEYDLAMIYAGLGENSKSLDLLEDCLTEKTIIRLVNFAVEPAFANVRSDPRFKALLTKVNLES